MALAMLPCELLAEAVVFEAAAWVLLPPVCRCDRDYVVRAARRNGTVTHYVSSLFRQDRGVVLEAVRQTAGRAASAACRVAVSPSRAQMASTKMPAGGGVGAGGIW